MRQNIIVIFLKHICKTNEKKENKKLGMLRIVRITAFLVKITFLTKIDYGDILTLSNMKWVIE